MTLGATGKFPMGKMHRSDEGQLRIAVGRERGKVVMRFGCPVAWIGMGPEEAEAIAQSLLHHAKECKA